MRDPSARPQRQLYDVQGKPVPDKAIDGFVDALNLKAIPGTQETRYGLVVHRADLRTFPTTTRVFSSDDDTDIDRFQESALFPGTPVAIRSEEHTSELQSLMRISYAVFCLKKKTHTNNLYTPLVHIRTLNI